MCCEKANSATETEKKYGIFSFEEHSDWKNDKWVALRDFQKVCFNFFLISYYTSVKHTIVSLPEKI